MNCTTFLNEHMSVFNNSAEALLQVQQVAEQIISALNLGKKVLICGNGGSAGDAQHFAAEIIGRFEIGSRRALPAIALSTDTSVLTAIGNDFGFEFIFSRQIDALCDDGDVVIGLSTSGSSRNVIEACMAAEKKGGIPIMFTGKQPVSLNDTDPLQINAPSRKTARIQEFHIFCIHCICALIDEEFGCE